MYPHPDGARPITESPPAAVRSATDMDGIKRSHPARRPYTTDRCDIVLRTGESPAGALRRRTNGLRHQYPRHSLQQLGALCNAAFDSAPLLFGEEQRHSTDRQPLTFHQRCGGESAIRIRRSAVAKLCCISFGSYSARADSMRRQCGRLRPRASINSSGIPGSGL